jgi:hypothetical protein
MTPDPASLPPIALMSWFGTLLCLDRRSGGFVHRGMEALDSWHIILELEPGKEGGAPVLTTGWAGGEGVRGLEIAPGALIPGCLTLRLGERFLSARPGGDAAAEAGEAKHWEQFLPISKRDLTVLADILARRWRMETGPAVPAGLAEFQLRFGRRAVSLAANLPLPAGAGAARLDLADGEGRVSLTAATKPPERRVWIYPLGNIGNRALQYLAAAGIAARAPGAKIENVMLEMWGRREPAPRPEPWERAGSNDHFLYHLDVDGLGDCLARGEVDAICLESYCFHLDHYPPRAECRVLLPPAQGTEDVRGFGPGELVCSVRAAEILHYAHPDYFPLPPGYYAKLQAESGLDLVFFGQLGDDAYSQALRAAFPRARFVPGVNQNHDFEVLRRSRNVALSISTFAWLAAWLGEAERVYLPVGGIFNPHHDPGMLFLPLAEPAYRYMLLPPVKAVSLADPVRFWLMQDVIARGTRPIGVEELRGLVARAAGREREMTKVKRFSSAAYLRAYPDVANEARALRRTGLDHYFNAGVKENRVTRPFDPLFYADRYPEAAEAVALGHYRTLFAHFQAVGEALGYQPMP